MSKSSATYQSLNDVADSIYVFCRIIGCFLQYLIGCMKEFFRGQLRYRFWLFVLLFYDVTYVTNNSDSKHRAISINSFSRAQNKVIWPYPDVLRGACQAIWNNLSGIIRAAV